MPFAFQFTDDFGGVLAIPALQSFLSALQPGPHARRVENFDGLVAKRLLECFREFLGRGVAMPGLFGHRLVDRLAHHLTDRRVQF